MMTTTGPSTIAVCAEYWTPIATRCQGCPIFATCNAPSQTSLTAIAARCEAMETEATAVRGQS